MSTKKRSSSLGRDLRALLGNDHFISEASTSSAKDLQQLPIEQLQRGKYQPRKHMRAEALAELADSIRAQGIIQPIVVRPIGKQQYEIIAGERRWRAAQLAGLSEVPVVIHDIPDKAAVAVALIENIQREDLSPIEEAVALQRLLKEFELTHEEVALAVGKSRPTITNLLRLLDLNKEVKTLLEEKRLELGHAKVLLGLTGPQQTQAALLAAEKNWSVRDTENYVKRLRPANKVKVKAPIDPDVMHLQNQLSDTLGANVQIQHSTNGKGKLVIQYQSIDELEGILAHIR